MSDDIEAEIRIRQEALRTRMMNEHRLARMDGMCLPGVRLAEVDGPGGVVITLSEAEQAPVLAALRGVLEARMEA
ncbi:MAG TPA: hypothetical protein PKA33_01660 [Amaricoccus sp.]|uniref:hypothetical protein n=1 Tax=Amaricoccus sp. TaxID=1872485 RepID=UPI002C2C1ABA|nr:hypothetical protein [Amaricoccus sp.]HMR51198.1 hypothetical protein [Amaricoccus sp.]HMT98053.1 hypothetical protein [Amaricoccus sp.]